MKMVVIFIFLLFENVISVPTAAPTPTALIPSLLCALDPTCTPNPSFFPTTKNPTRIPSPVPSLSPSCTPSIFPTSSPSYSPTESPSPIPSILPSLEPTSTPTIFPSNHPSEFPSIDPTTLPSILPSTTPTLFPSLAPSDSPSLLPTITPSEIPSYFPSDSPTQAPSLLPSVQPTVTISPTALPTSEPTAFPTTFPTHSPTICPSISPSEIPSSFPSDAPSWFPSALPTALPTSTPTLLSSTVPTDTPTVNPSSSPSETPSEAPTQIPSLLPTILSSVATSPTILPSSEPTAFPTTFPTHTPTVDPSSSPSEIPSSFPSDAPTQLPTFQPTSMPTLLATGSPSIEPSSPPTVLPTNIPSTLPSSIPTVVPTKFPTSNPTTPPTSPPSCLPSPAPSASPTTQPTHQPTQSPTQSPTLSPSPILPSISLTVTPMQSSLKVVGRFVGLSSLQSQGVMYCGIFTSSQAHSPSPISILRQQFSSSLKDSQSTVTISNLIPSTKYFVFCLLLPSSPTVKANVTTDKILVSQEYAVTTLCCRDIYLTMSSRYFLSQSNSLSPSGLNVLKIWWSFPLVPDLRIDLKCLYYPPQATSSSSSSSSSPASGGASSNLVFPFFPSSIILNSSIPRSSSLAYSSLRGSLLPGIYQFEFTMTSLLPSSASTSASASTPAVASSDYTLHVQATNFTIIDGNSNSNPSPVSFSPRMLSCILSDDGSYLMITFDMPTNYGGLGMNFPCSSLFLLNSTVPKSATCVWQSSFEIFFYSSSSSTSDISLHVGAKLTLLEDKLRSVCLQGSTSTAVNSCSNYPLSPSHSLLIQYPQNPVTPEVVLSSPSILGNCQSLMIDVTASKGGCGRPWSNWSIEVTSPSSQDGVELNISSLQSFLQLNYSITHPTSIPFTFFVANQTYLFSITLCNSLNQCNHPLTHVVRVVSETVPISLIHGPKNRRFQSSNPLRLSASGYIQECGVVRPTTTGVAYNWELFLVETESISEFNSIEKLTPIPVTSTSRIPTIFALAGHSLSPGSLYLVRFTVSILQSGVSSDSSIRLSVESPKVVANLKSSSGTIEDQTLRVGEVLHLDGSESYDEIDSFSSLYFEWSCAMIIPLELNNCVVDIQTVNTTTHSQVAISPIRNSSAINATVSVTLSVYNSLRTRVDSRSIVFFILEEISLKVTTTLITTAHTNSRLRIEGQVTLPLSNYSRFDGTLMTWSVNDPSLNLTDISLSPIRKRISIEDQRQVLLMNLVLKPNSLPVYGSYLFTLRCLNSFSSVLIVISGPPRSGSFTISPDSGQEDTDIFLLLASGWIDEEDNLPLTYRFGFYSSRGSHLFLGFESEKNSIDAILPRGDPLFHFQLICFTQVINILAVSSNQTQNIQVLPNYKSYESLDLFISSRLLMASSGSDSDSGSSSLDLLEESLSSLATQVNSVNCSLSPNCTALGRRSCSTIPHSCGECMEGYVGEIGHWNTPCASNLLPVDRNETKSCPGNCSGHGICQFRSKSTYNLLNEDKDCQINDPSCVPVCSCVYGYTTSDCSLTMFNLTLKMNSRMQLLNSFSNLFTREDHTSSFLQYSISLLSEILSPPSELSYELCSQGMNQLTQIMDVYLTLLQEEDMSNEVLFQIYQPLMSCLEFYGGEGVTGEEEGEGEGEWWRYNTTTEEKTNGITQILSIWRDYQSLLSSEMVSDEEYLDSLFPILSSRSLVIDSSLNSLNSHTWITYPMSPLEEVLQYPNSSIQFPASLSSVTTTVAIQSYASRLRTNFTNFLSDPMEVTLTLTRELNSSVDLETESHKILFQLAHSSSRPFPNSEDLIENYTTHCRRGEVQVQNLSCSSGEIFTHRCDGTSSFNLVTMCPSLIYSPDCQSLLGEEEEDVEETIKSCQVLNYSSSHIFCLCEINLSPQVKSDDNSRRQLLGGFIRSGGRTVVAIGKYQKVQIQTTVLNVDNLRLGDLKGSVEVLIMFTFMWFVVPCAVFIISYLNTTNNDSKPRKSRISTVPLSGPVVAPHRPSRTRRSSLQVSGTTAYTYLLKYIDSIIPVIFQPKQSLWNYISHEILEHHRYINIFLFSTKQSDKIRYLTTFQMLTVQSMLIFLLSIFFDLQYPSHANAETCGQYAEEESCVLNKSIFDPEESICRWIATNTTTTSPGNGYCRETQIHISTKVMIILVIFISATAAPINYFIDFLMNILFATSCDEHSSPPETTNASPLKRSFTRTASELLNKGIGKIQKTMSNVTVALQRRSRVQSFKQIWMTEEETIKLPETVVHSHTLARTAIHTLAKKADEVEGYVNPFGDQVVIDHSSPFFQAIPKRDMSRQDQQAKNSLSLLFTQMLSQYEKLSGPTKTLYAESWGIDTTCGGFIQPHYSDEIWNCSCRSVDMERLLADELKAVTRLSRSKINKLKQATDVHCGLVIIHLFIADLLGRNTPAGKIFEHKTEEDFGQSAVVTPAAKRVALLTMIFLNVIFTVFTLARCLERDETWQRNFIWACFTQFLIELFFFETTECIWIHYSLPTLVQSDVEEAVRTLYGTLDLAFSNMIADNLIFNMPQFLFVSNQVASQFSHLFESSIVLSFQTFMGGKIGEKLKEKSLQKQQGLFHDSIPIYQRFLSYFSLYSYLLLFGTTPLGVQRFLVHSVQPFAVAGISQLFVVIVNKPWLSFIPLSILLVVTIRYLINSNRKSLHQRSKIFSLHQTGRTSYGNYKRTTAIELSPVDNQYDLEKGDQQKESLGEEIRPTEPVNVLVTQSEAVTLGGALSINELQLPLENEKDDEEEKGIMKVETPEGVKKIQMISKGRPTYRGMFSLPDEEDGQEEEERRAMERAKERRKSRRGSRRGSQDRRRSTGGGGGGGGGLSTFQKLSQKTYSRLLRMVSYNDEEEKQQTHQQQRENNSDIDDPDFSDLDSFSSDGDRFDYSEDDSEPSSVSD